MSLEGKEWGNFTVGDIGEVLTGVGISEKDRRPGNIPYISSTSINNGVSDFLGNKNSTVEAGCISVNSNGSIGYSFYHPYSALYSADCSKVRLNVCNKNVAVFIANQITVQREKYGYGYKMGAARLRRQIIQLPVDEQGKPDYIFIEQYMKQRGQKMIQDYLEYIEPRLKIKPKKVKFEGREWKEFYLSDIFSQIQRGKRLKTADHVQGNIPYISSSAASNGVDAFIGNKSGVRKFNNCLTIANSGSVGKTFFHDYDLIASDHVTMLKSGSMNKYAYLFISVLTDRLQEKYNFNHEISDKRINHEMIILPVDSSGKPDYKFMEDYMKSLEHEILLNYIKLHKNL